MITLVLDVTSTLSAALFLAIALTSKDDPWKDPADALAAAIMLGSQVWMVLRMWEHYS